jgi:hypothetical protein
MGGACRKFKENKKYVQNSGWKISVEAAIWKPRLRWEGYIQIQKTIHNNSFGQRIPYFYVTRSFLSELTEPHYWILS